MSEFSKKEKKQICNIMKNVIGDMHRLLKAGDLDSIKVNINYDKSDKSVDYSYIMFNYEWLLEITSERIWIWDRENCRRGFTPNPEGKFYLDNKHDYFPIMYVFINHYYSENRDLIIKEIENQKKEREGRSKNIERLLEKSNTIKNATIRMDLPPSLNPYEIEITKEKGRNVGRIDFGERTIEIETDGDIVVVPKKDDKVKQKTIGTK